MSMVIVLVETRPDWHSPTTPHASPAWAEVFHDFKTWLRNIEIEMAYSHSMCVYVIQMVNPYRVEIAKETWEKNFFFWSHSDMKMSVTEIVTMGYKDSIIVQGHSHGHWWPDDARNRVSGGHGIDIASRSNLISSRGGISSWI